MNEQYPIYPSYFGDNQRVFPVVPFLTGLVLGPLLYNAFQPYPYYPYTYPPVYPYYPYPTYSYNYYS
ncbi:hypothetical protein GCM10010978_08690 [Compostibacillus humi]|uniref:Uncharacterized protein n=1 Tax=Compostibacillus humi TaxID=1245525 RepID=A0A8J2ZQZ1_9BACI|nr:hypothetical protein [Compostibacillus humi]GGH72096.1 hypothetical protein GCM10010978_08690 [Compostibacillus humi]HLT55739.1 hypothetical protein [Bacillota bacterium]